MLAELLKHDHGQKARAGPSPGHGMERCRRLADLLAIAAGELLPTASITFHRAAPLPVFASRPRRACEGDCCRSLHKLSADRSPPRLVADARGEREAQRALVRQHVQWTA